MAKGGVKDDGGHIIDDRFVRLMMIRQDRRPTRRRHKAANLAGWLIVGFTVLFVVWTVWR